MTIASFSFRHSEFDKGLSKDNDLFIQQGIADELQRHMMDFINEGAEVKFVTQSSVVKDGDIIHFYTVFYN